MANIIDDAVDFLKSLLLGDFVEEQPISAQVVGGLIALVPVVQQVMNARDVSGVLFRINRKGGFAHATRDDYIGLGFAALAVIPEAGSVFKMVFKPLWKERRLAGAALRTGMEMIERMLGMAKGGAVKWIKALQWGALTEQAITGVNAALDAMQELLEYLAEPHWWVPDSLAEIAKDVLPGVKAMKGKIAEPLAKGVEAIHQFVNDLLGEDGAAIAMAVVATVASTSTKAHGQAEKIAATHIEKERVARAPKPEVERATKPAAKPAKPTGEALAKAAGSEEHPPVAGHATQATDKGEAGAPTRTSKPTSKAFASITRTIQGIVGEHIADYHCIEGKGWAHGWSAHDKGHEGRWEVSPLSDLTTPGKLNDGTIPVQLKLQGPRGRGIDGLWRKKAMGPQKYGVVEAKCYMNPAQKLSTMLADVFDKDEYTTYRETLKQSKGTAKGTPGSKRRAANKTAAAPGIASPSPTPAPPSKPEANVMQMSHVWIEQRLRGPFGKDVRNDILIKFGGSPNYSRHVMLVSTPNVLQHYEAIERAVVSGGGVVDVKDHKSHTITREFGDAQIAQEERSRVAARSSPVTSS